MKANSLVDRILPFILPMVLLGFWQISSTTGYLPRALVSAPVEVIVDFGALLLNGELLVHSLVSLGRLVAGFGLGAIVGFVLGVGCGVFIRAEKIFFPTFQFLAPVPPIAWIPLLIILLGIGETSKIGLIFIGVFCIVFSGAFHAVRSVDNQFIELSSTYKKKRLDLITQVLIPASLPEVFSALRMALGLAWVLLIAAEAIASSNGLGWLIWDARNFSRPADMFVGIIAIGLLGKATDLLASRAEQKITFWKKSFGGN